MIANIIFLALAFFAISGAIAMIVYKNPMFSALGVLISMLSIAVPPPKAMFSGIMT